MERLQAAADKQALVQRNGVRGHLLLASHAGHDRTHDAGEIPDRDRQGSLQLLAGPGPACLPIIAHHNQAELPFVIRHASEEAVHALKASQIRCRSSISQGRHEKAEAGQKPGKLVADNDQLVRRLVEMDAIEVE